VRPRTVVVAHRETMVAEGIAAALGTHPAIVPVAGVTSTGEAERRADGSDAVALDERLPGATQTAARLRRKGIRVVFIGDPAEQEDGVRVPTRAPVITLARALVPELENGHRNGHGTRSVRTLSRRQKEVLDLVARGLAAKQVARQLGISPKTVELHKTRIFRKLGVPNQTAAVSQAFRQREEGMDPWIRSST
jgi:DNA-binding CsgD family transcriptional regulator